MAILEDLPGVEVTVRVDDVDLHELGDPNDDEQHHVDADDSGPCPSVTSYVECADNAEFAVHLSIDGDYPWGYRDHVLCARVRIDGQHVRGEVFRQRDMRYNRALDLHVSERCVVGRELFSEVSGTWALRKFKFSVVDTVDEAQRERVERDSKIAKDLGVIEVRIYRAIEHGPSRHSNHGRSQVQPSGFELSEKSLKGKAISHGTSYGMPQYVPPPSYIDVRDMPEDNGPIGIYRFLYRSREALKRELIIPRSPTRSPVLEELSAAERDRLARERLAELRRIKKESKRPIKREQSEILDLTDDAAPVRRPWKKSRSDNGREIIDLTED
ncbi:hypothetical protein F4780DRAFT_169649 [Xylariomycetidae sp. FL0641]|nr:hypothetical protein F4780DRAFT_169649 [Xylariomycetidae sp. FL0641]